MHNVLDFGAVGDGVTDMEMLDLYVMLFNAYTVTYKAPKGLIPCTYAQ